jgi:hypothetical protein
MTLKDFADYLEEEFNKHRILITTSGTAFGRWLHHNGIAEPRFFLSVCVLSLGTAGYYLFYKRKSSLRYSATLWLYPAFSWG